MLQTSRSGVSVLTTRELFDFVIDETIGDATEDIQSHIDMLSRAVDERNRSGISAQEEVMRDSACASLPSIVGSISTCNFDFIVMRLQQILLYAFW